MGIFQSVGGAATSGRGFTGRQIAEALRAAADAQRKRHIERTSSPSFHKRSRSVVVQTLQDLTPQSFTETDTLTTTAVDGNTSSSVQVTEYAPDVFRYLRQLEGVQEEQFCDEWTLPEERLRLELGEGRSMAMFLKSKSMEFMCKTISEAEVEVLLRILHPYSQHLSENRHSLLMRFLMLLKVEANGEVGYILCFADIFAGCDVLNERWDIKGRHPKPGKYRQFPKWALEQTCENMNLGPAHDGVERETRGAAGLPHVDKGKLVTRKDKDLTRVFWLDPMQRDEIVTQLEEDFRFLRSCGLMDYSVLVGVKYAPQGISSSPARSMRMTYALGEEGQRNLSEVRAKSREASPGGFAFHYDPKVITHNSMYHYGILSCERHETYYIGIIDMLTEYNIKKKAANFFKKFLWRENTLSTVPPALYEKRIFKYARRIFATKVDSVSRRDAPSESEYHSAGS